MNICMIGRFKRFEDLYKSQSLEKYFGLIHNYDTFKIIPQKTENNTLLLTIQVEKKHYHDFKQLPSDLSHYISEYLTEYITICIEIIFPTEYPFQPPIYTLLSTKYNIGLPISVDNYYNKLVDNHNIQYKREWSPAIDIEKDILYFICRINHFEYLL